jgi:hypothetical protein
MGYYNGGGSGDVVGPGSSTDNAVARFDGTTGKILQNSGILIDDSDNISGVNNVTGSDVNFVTGTAGVSANLVSWNADGDAVDSGVAASAVGDVTAGANITDNALVRGDGGAKGIQDSGIIIDDLDNISIPGTATIEGVTTVDVTNAEALLIRKNGDTGDVFTVDTSTSKVRADAQMEIDSAANNVQLDITNPSVTTSDGVTAVFDGLTTGSAFSISSNSSSTSTRTLFDVTNNHSSAINATVMALHQDSTETNLVLDTNGNATSLGIDSEATSLPVIQLVTPQSTSGDIFQCSSANSLTTGSILDLQSNSSSTSTRNLVQIVNEHASAINATCLSLRQDSTERAMFIDQNGNGISLQIDSQASTSDVIQITNPTTTTGSVFSTAANNLTTGQLLDLQSNSSSTSTRNLVQIVNNHASAGNTTPLAIQQDSAQRALYIDQNGNDSAIEIDSEATSTNIIEFINPIITTGDGLSLTNFNSLTSGRIIHAHSKSNSTSTRKLVTVHQEQSNAPDTTCVEVIQSSTANNSRGITTSGGTNDLQSGLIIKRTATATSMTADIHDYLIGVTNTASPRIVTLPSAATISGKEYVVKDESGNAGTNNITVATAGAETIDGAATATIATNYGSVKVYSDGTNWFTK